MLREELTKIIIKNIGQHSKTEILLSDKITWILAGNGTGKSILTELICLKPGLESNAIEKNLLNYWTKIKGEKSKITFKYNKSEKNTNSLVLDANNNLKWTKDKKDYFKPNAVFFNEHNSFESINRNLKGEGLMSLSEEVYVANLGYLIVHKYNIFLDLINFAKLENNIFSRSFLKNVKYKYNYKYGINTFSKSFLFFGYHFSNKLEEKENINSFLTLIINNDFKNFLTLIKKKDIKNQNLYYIFFIKLWILWKKTEDDPFLYFKNAFQNLRRLNLFLRNFENKFLDIFFLENDFNEIKKEIKLFIINAEFLYFFIKNIRYILEYYNVYLKQIHRNDYNFLDLIIKLNPEIKLEYLHILHSSDYKEFIKEVEKNSNELKYKSSLERASDKKIINDMLDRTYLKNKIIIDEELNIISPSKENINIRISTAEVRLIYLKKYLIDLQKQKKPENIIDLLIFDDITSSMDYQFIDLIYSEIKIFYEEYKEINTKFKIIFLTHSDSAFNYFMNKELGKKNKDKIHFYNMFQSSNNKVLIENIENDKVEKFEFKKIRSLLSLFYSSKIDDSLKLTLIRKIMECLAIVMNGSNELGTFLINDDKVHKFYFKTIVGRIYISRFAYEMLNNESHFDINDFYSIDSTMKIKRAKIIKEFKDIFTRNLNFPNENNKIIQEKEGDIDYKSELKKLNQLTKDENLSKLLIKYKYEEKNDFLNNLSIPDLIKKL